MQAKEPIHQQTRVAAIAGTIGLACLLILEGLLIVVGSLWFFAAESHHIPHNTPQPVTVSPTTNVFIAGEPRR